MNRPRQTRLQWGGFGKKKKETAVEDVICPYKQCGRKFASPDQLRIHIERRHKAVEQPKEELVVSTPVPTKSKVDGLKGTPKVSQSGSNIKTTSSGKKQVETM